MSAQLLQFPTMPRETRTRILQEIELNRIRRKVEDDALKQHFLMNTSGEIEVVGGFDYGIGQLLHAMWMMSYGSLFMGGKK